MDLGLVLVFFLTSEEMLMQLLVKEAMESAINLAVPMEVELKLAQNWLEAH